MPIYKSLRTVRPPRQPPRAAFIKQPTPTYSRTITVSAIGYITIDFGGGAGSGSTNVSVTGQTAITGTSYAEAFFMADSTSDHTVEDHCWANTLCALTCSAATAGTGFTIYARAIDKMTGTYKVRFTWAD